MADAIKGSKNNSSVIHDLIHNSICLVGKDLIFFKIGL